MNCPKCGGTGVQEYVEDGRPVFDACYHCENTGHVSEETYAQKKARRFEEMLDALASIATSRAEKTARENETGEDWSFYAAENMCSLMEFRLVQFEINRKRIMEEVNELSDWGKYVLAESLLPIEEKPKVVHGPVEYYGDDVPF